MSYRYYSTIRPVSINTYPKPEGNEVLEINNFDELRAVPEIGRAAWGWIDYASPLSDSEAANYDLIAKTTLPPRIAVGVGSAYNVFPAEVVEGVGVSLKKTGLKLIDEGEVFELYKATTFPESQKVDMMLDAYGEKPVGPAVYAYSADSRECRPRPVALL